jgi:glucokinase
MLSYQAVLVLGVDIGGTKIAAGQVESLGTDIRVKESVTVPTLALAGYPASLEQLHKAIDGSLSPEVAAIGICAPGPLNPRTGVVLNPPNLPGWCNIPLAALMEDRYGLPCCVENDANAAGLAEVKFGAARGYSHVLYVTLSTGIGAGIIINGHIYHGKNGAAGEGGHVSIDYKSQAICNCGVPGCIEALASGIALAARGIAPEEMTPAQLDEVATMLSAWLGGMISVLDPEIIVIGGGMSQIGEPLFDRLRMMTPTRTINQFACDTPIVPALLAANVGLLGAASAALDLLHRALH